MSNGRLVSWAIVAGTVCLPVNWFRIYFTEPAEEASPLPVVLASVVSLTIGAAIVFFLIQSAKGIRILKEKRAAALAALAAQPLKAIRPREAILNGSEIAYGAMNATLKETQTVGYSSGSSGVSVRVMKGVTIHSGRTLGHAVKGVVTVSSGEVVITDQRVIFAGDTKSFTIPLAKLINVTNYADGVAFHEEHKSFLLVGADQSECDAFAITVQKVLDQRANPNVPLLRKMTG
jgi:hypothetical protein